MLRRSWYAWFGGIVLMVAACGGGGEGPTADLSEHVIGGDLLLVMQPGEGRGEEAEQLAAPFADPFGVKEGTANHVAWFNGEYRPMHSNREKWYPMRTRAAIIGGTVCRVDLMDGSYLMDDRHLMDDSRR